MVGLFEPKAHALGFFGAASFADDCFAATFAFGNWFRETHLRLFEGHNTTLKNLAVETADEVFIRFVLIFSSYFNSHIENIIAKLRRSGKRGFKNNYEFWKCLCYNLSMIILMGLAGSGKSTQGKILADKLGRVWLSAGQVLRDSGKFQETLDKGELVDDTVAIKMMAEAAAEVIKGGKNVILDGFPRDVDQAEWMAENIASAVELIIRIEVPKGELWERIRLRGRTDDTEKSVLQRFKIVEQNIYTVCEILGKTGVKTVVVDGLGTREEVTGRILAVLEQEGIIELGANFGAKVESMIK